MQGLAQVNSKFYISVCLLLLINVIDVAFGFK